MVRGFKAFDSKMNNRYGKHFTEGGEYSVLGPAVYGTHGNGYHFCKRLEDTLRYVDGMSDDIQIAEVVGYGDVRESFDNYYGYYNMYVASNIQILRVLSREEIISKGLNMPEYRSERFVKGYKLTDDEIDLFKGVFSDDDNVLRAIAYYQEGDEKAYDIDKEYIYIKQYKTKK